MQSTTTQFATAFDTGYLFKAKARVLIEWNWNRYEANPIASNGGDTSVNEVFPITSIMEARRPNRAGIYKMRAGEGRISSRNKPYYSPRTASKNAKYKYWSSTTQSNSSFPYNITGCAPQVLYSTQVRANKIVIQLENSWSQPESYRILTTSNGSTWTIVAENPAINANGQIILYHHGPNDWRAAINRDVDHTTLRGVRLSVTSMNKSNAHVNVVEISARLEKDISDEVFSVSVNKSVGQADEIRPLGEMEANTGSLTIDNSTGKYNNDNTASPYARLINRYAKVTVDYGIDKSVHGGTGIEYVPQGVFYVENWGESDDSLSVSANLFDYTVFLQNEQMHEVLYINKTAGQIIRDILMSNGFNDFVQLSIPDVVDPVIPYVWFNSETTVWDAIKEVAEADQGAGWFNEVGTFVYYSRDYIETMSSTTNLTLQATNVGSKVANIEELSEEFNVAANSVVVQWTPQQRNERTYWRDATNEEVMSRTADKWKFVGPNGLSKYTTEYTEPNYVPVWKAENTVALQATRVLYGMDADDTSMWIPQSDAQIWPYSGYMNVQGETMSFEGKQYRYYASYSGLAPLVIVKNHEEKEKYDRMTPASMRHMNYFTGYLTGIKRGQMGSKARPHTNGIYGWDQTYRWDRSSGTVAYIPGYASHKPQDGTLLLKGPGYASNNTMTYIPKTQPTFTKEFPGYGGIVIFRKTGRARNTAGIMMHWTGSGGIFLELNTTDYTTKLGGTIGNIRLYYQTNTRRVEPNTQIMHEITYNVPYEIEAKWTGSKFAVFLDGEFITSLDVRAYGGPESGDWGPFVVGQSSVEFDALYYYSRESHENDDQSQFFHKVKGAFQSDTSRAYAYARQSEGLITDWRISEFSPVVHEVREFDVTHDPSPVLSSRIYNTNFWDSFVMSSYSNAFRTKFVIANASRGAAILNGEDPTIFGPDDVVPQQLIVEGQNIQPEEEEKRNEYKNLPAIRKNGKVEVTFNNRWIQTKQQADLVGEYVVERWGDTVDNISVQCLVTPAVQLGDYVTVHYPARAYNASTHRYSVTGIETEFNGGFTTTLRLRRLR